MNYAAIKKYDIADGEGVRVSLFVSGCTHHCKGCFQPETWSFDYGNPFDETVEDEIMKALEPDYIAGLTLLGGEPMESENAKRLYPFVKRVRETYPSKNVWCYSGYLFEELVEREECRRLLELIDVLVDGEFVEEQKNIALQFRGSENQRIIDVRKSLKDGNVVLRDFYQYRNSSSLLFHYTVVFQLLHFLPS